MPPFGLYGLYINLILFTILLRQIDLLQADVPLQLALALLFLLFFLLVASLLLDRLSAGLIVFYQVYLQLDIFLTY